MADPCPIPKVYRTGTGFIMISFKSPHSYSTRYESFCVSYVERHIGVGLSVEHVDAQLRQRLLSLLALRVIWNTGIGTHHWDIDLKKTKPNYKPKFSVTNKSKKSISLMGKFWD